MKTLQVLLILLVSSSMFAQEPTFPTEGASWVTRHISPCIGGTTIIYNWTEYLAGDTIIDNKTYTKLFLQKECIYQNTGTHCLESYSYPESESFVMGVIREENGKVIFKKFDVPDHQFESYERELKHVPPDVEIILYDMNWEVGDSVTYPVENGEALLFDVIAVQDVNGKKKFALQLRDGFPWEIFESLEGMGGKMGLFNMYYANLTAGNYLAVPVCFYHHGELVQEGEYCANPCDLTNIDAPGSIVMPHIFPNPFDQQLMIQLRESGVATISILDTFGKVIGVQSTSSFTETFETNNWSSGIYFIRIDINGKRTVQKVIKK